MSDSFKTIKERCRSTDDLENEGARLLPIFGEFTSYDFEDSLEVLRKDWPHRTGRFELCYVATARTTAELLGLPPVDDDEGDNGEMYVLPKEVCAQGPTSSSRRHTLMDAEYTLIMWPDQPRQ